MQDIWKDIYKKISNVGILKILLKVCIIGIIQNNKHIWEMMYYTVGYYYYKNVITYELIWIIVLLTSKMFPLFTSSASQSMFLQCDLTILLHNFSCPLLPSVYIYICFTWK